MVLLWCLTVVSRCFIIVHGFGWFVWSVLWCFMFYSVILMFYSGFLLLRLSLFYFC